MNSGKTNETTFNLSLAGGKLEYEITGNSDGNLPPANKKIKKYSDFGVVVYEKKTYSVNYKVINDPDTDGIFGLDKSITTTLPSYITKTSLEDGLNKIYKQGVVSWDVTDSGTQNVEFDTNNDGILNYFKTEYIDSVTMQVTNITLGEYDELNNLAKDTSFDRNIFFVDGVPPGIFGINKKFGRFIDVHPVGHSGSTQTIINTVAHELGHSLKLEHVNKVFRTKYTSLFGYTPTFPVLIKKPSNNLMLSGARNPKKLFKKQWDKINKE